MIVYHVEFVSFDELEPEISHVKGGPGPQTGGTPSRQSDGHLSPGGECFASKMKYNQRDENYQPKLGPSTPLPVFTTSGKPSTWLPLGRLVEQT